MDYLYDILGEDVRDKYFMELIDRLFIYATGSKLDEVFITQSDLYGKLERRSYVNFRYGEYTFISMLNHFGKEYAEALKVVNELNLSIFPKLILVREYEDGSMYIVIKIPGNVGEDIKWGHCLSDINSLPISSRQQAVSDLKKLETAGYLLLPKFRFSVGVTHDGHIMISDIPLVKKEEAQDFLDDIYSSYSMFGWFDDYYHLQHPDQKLRCHK